MCYTLRFNIKSSGQPVIIEDIEEFTSSYQFFFIRKLDGTTISFDRQELNSIERMLKNGEFKSISLLKPRKKYKKAKELRTFSGEKTNVG